MPTLYLKRCTAVPSPDPLPDRPAAIRHHCMQFPLCLIPYMKKTLTSIYSLLIAVILLQPEAAAQYSKPVIIADAPTVGPGSQTILHTNPVPGATCQWSDGGPATASRAAGPDNYAVTVTIGACTETSGSFVIKETPAPLIIPDRYPEICAGDSIILHTDTGNYWRGENNGCMVPSDSIQVTATVLSSPITFSPADTICMGDSVQLTAVSGDNWTQKNELPVNHLYSNAFVLGTTAYALGGGNRRGFYRYDQATDNWTRLPDLPQMVGQSVAVSWRGMGWMYSSYDGCIWMYDPQTAIWTKKAECPGPRSNIAQGFLLNDHLYLAGGANTESGNIVLTSEVWAYDLVNDTWTRKNDLPLRMGQGTGFAVNGKGFLCTGYSSNLAGGDLGLSDLFLQYDPLTDTWTMLPPFPGGPRYGPISFVAGQKAYAGLGRPVGSPLPDLWQFDPVTLTWTRLADIPSGRYASWAMVLGRFAYIGGGYGAVPTERNLWQYSLPLQYQWSTGDTSRSIWVKQTGDYELTLNIDSGCTITVPPVHIEVQPVARIVRNPSDTAVCPDASLHFAANATGAGITYQWQFNGADLSEGGAYSGTQTNQLSIADAGIPGAGLFRCIATGTCGADTSAEATQTLYALPPKPTIARSGPTEFCEEGSVTLTSSAGNGNTWSTGTTGQNIFVTTSGTYTVTVTTINGCSSPESDPVTVTVHPNPPQPVITAGGPLEFCAGNSVLLSTAPAAQYHWSDGKGTQTITVNQTGNYSVQITDDNSCTSPSSPIVAVAVHPLPVGAIVAQGPFVSGNTRYMELQAPSLPGGSYRWNTGDSAATIRVSQSGYYRVTVTNTFGCAQSFDMQIALIDLSNIPNTFTPNRDGVNDYWTIPNLHLFPRARVSIFNRNGNKVYEATGTIRWDGTSNGKELPAGVYYYILDLRDGGQPVNGWINLMK